MFKRYSLSLILLFSLSFFPSQNASAQSEVLEKGEKAPLFSAQASLAGEAFQFSLKAALSKGPVVVYFYPAAYTRGCDLEAKTFAELKDKFTAAGASIIGVSADNIKRLNDFSADPNYCAGKFPVASDPKGKIAASYGLEIRYPQSTITDVRGDVVKHGFIPRTTFVINADREIVAVFSSKMDDISPVQHVKKSLVIVKSL